MLTRQDPVGELLSGGVPLGGQVSAEILEAIFRKVSPVHDGATVIEGDRITRVGALLPLSQNDGLPRNWGTRHRAGFGLVERTDAVIVVASEERGELTLMHGRAFEEARTVDALVGRLKVLFSSEPVRDAPPTAGPSNQLLWATAVGLALVIWGTTVWVEGQ